MSAEIKNINEETINEVTEIQEVEEVKESKIKIFGAKVWGGVKKYGKPVVALAAIAGGVLIAYKLGKNSTDCGYESDADYTSDYEETPVNEIEDDVTTE